LAFAQSDAWSPTVFVDKLNASSFKRLPVWARLPRLYLPDRYDTDPGLSSRCTSPCLLWARSGHLYSITPRYAPHRTFKALADGAISFGTIENLIKNPKAPAPTGDHPRTMRWLLSSTALQLQLNFVLKLRLVLKAVIAGQASY
jgi:hypothetical protein